MEDQVLKMKIHMNGLTDRDGNNEDCNFEGGCPSVENGVYSNGGTNISHPATNQQPIFCIGGEPYYDMAIVTKPLLNMGWRETLDINDQNIKLKFYVFAPGCKMNQQEFKIFKEGKQLINRIPNCHLLTDKLGLHKSLQEFEQTHSLNGTGRRWLKRADFLPETYWLDDEHERETFYKTFKEGEIWICKLTGMYNCRGRDMYLVRDADDIRRAFQKNDESVQGRLIQRYIMNPLLLEGRKFDIRTYMLIANTVPYVILANQGYVRLSLYPFDNNDDNMTVHLTNRSVQKKDPRYEELKETSVWSIKQFNDYINKNVAPYKNLEKDWVYSSLMNRMKEIMIQCVESVKDKFGRRLGYFEMFGLDFMVDENMKVFLLEVTLDPSFNTNCPVSKATLPPVVDESLRIALECFEKSKANQPILPLDNMKVFSLVQPLSGV